VNKLRLAVIGLLLMPLLGAGHPPAVVELSTPAPARATAPAPTPAPTPAPAEVPARQASPEAVSQVALTYEAYIAGINAGSAELMLQRSPLRSNSEDYQYHVEGTARSKGLWESFQQWRAEYSVTGQVAATTGVVPGHFYSLQTTPKKRREIHIRDGVLRETKNHKVRDPRPAQTGFDLLSAMFFLPPCHPSARVHTGRDGYTLARRGAGEANKCRYSVTDENGDTYKMSLIYAVRAGFSVPVSVDVEGPMNGRMVLSKAAAPVRRAGLPGSPQ